MRTIPWAVGAGVVLTILATLFSPQNDVLIAVMGATGSGKTTFVNTASRGKLPIGHGLQSCTQKVQVSNPFRLDGHRVRLIDTPGFDDSARSDADVLATIASFLASSYRSGTKLAGVVYLHRITDHRMGGISMRNFRVFRELCGEASLTNVVLATTVWDEVSSEIGNAREVELSSSDMFFKPALDSGARLVRLNNTREGTLAILRDILQNHPIPLLIQRELVDEGVGVSSSYAGSILNDEREKQAKKHQEELHRLQEAMSEAILQKDREARAELDENSSKLIEEISQVRAETENMVSSERAYLDGLRIMLEFHRIFGGG